MLARDHETIIAQCTPQGTGALALIRISGDDAVSIVDRIAHLSSKQTLASLPTHTIHHGTVVDAKGTVVDDVLFFLMRAPRTFTGQDTVEITCHNNQFIVAGIIARAIDCGARMAGAGEFSKQSVLNKKLSVLQAEAIHEIITANNHDALKRSLAQLHGSLSSWCTQIEKELVRALALSEASFEFIDEEHLSFGSHIREIVTGIQTRIAHLTKHAQAQQHIREGVRIALIGAVNAGKSSLFNALTKRDRSIVTELPGTTRDTVEAGLYRNGLYWTLIDTAGLRETTDRIEKEGISRSHAAADEADLILLVIDGSQSLSDAQKEEHQTFMQRHKTKTVVIKSKADLPPANDVSKWVSAHGTVDMHAVSVRNDAMIEKLEKAIQKRTADLLNSTGCPFLLNQRQLQGLVELEKKLESTAQVLTEPVQYELLSHHIGDALETISNLTGKSISEAGMDAVFREFCVGK